MTRRRANREGSIGFYNGRWTARVTLPDGRRKAFYGATHQEVRRKLTAALQALDAGDAPSSGDRVTTGAYLVSWLEAKHPRIRPATFRAYESHVRLYFLPAFGHVRLAHLTPAHVDRLMDEQVRGGLSANSVRRIRATLRSALSTALRDGLVSRNVAALAKPPRVPMRRTEAVTPAQARLILDAITGHHLESLFTLALTTGLRQGEVLGLQWPDVDMDTATLSVRHALQRVNGELVLVEPKSDSSRRNIPLTGLALNALRTHREQQRADAANVGVQWRPTELIFTTRSGLPLDGTSVTHQFQRALSDVPGLPHLRFHDLRHAFATLLLSQGAGMREVMEQLGHSQIHLTMNTYAHVVPLALRNAAERVDQVLSADDDAS